jgi:hypothetical protein
MPASTTPGGAPPELNVGSSVPSGRIRAITASPPLELPSAASTSPLPSVARASDETSLPCATATTPGCSASVELNPAASSAPVLV